MELNLSEIVWPICLLKCNVALQQLRIDDELTLTVGDAEIADNLIQIIKSYPDLTYEMTVSRQENCIKVMVKRRELVLQDEKALTPDDDPIANY